MGQEAICAVRFGKERGEGKALLETSELIFRGEFRLKIPFVAMKSVKAADGELHVQTDNGVAIFMLGEKAAKWCEKILNPKSRVEKLGVKTDAKVALVGDFESDFVEELKKCADKVTRGKINGEAEWVFFAAEKSGDLTQIAKLVKGMKNSAGLWVIYPKGRKEITENDVLSAGRKVGLKDVKVVGFSATRTALKFVVPVAKR